MPKQRTPNASRITKALLLIDLINTWKMQQGKAVLRGALAVLPQLRRLKARAVAAGVPVIYANDNFGQWRSDFHQVVAHARESLPQSARIVDALQPDAADYFVLKPRHSAFFATPLELLLEELAIDTLVLTGVVGDQCVLASASDALLRKLRVIVPRDTIACADARRRDAVLEHFRTAMDVPTPPSSRVRWR